MTAEIRSALSFIPADDRETWLHVAFALKSEMPDGFDLFNSWSATAENYDKESVVSTWRCAKATGKITIGTLFHYAQQHGWKPGPDHQGPSPAELQASQQASAARDRAEAERRAKGQAEAAKKAAWILDRCNLEQHAYLESKGWPEMQGLVWRPKEDENLLVIPMRVGSHLVGAQLIDREGVKKFLPGQRASGAEFIIGQRGRDWLCEGYATALSVQAALSCLKQPYRIHCCFSAGNMVKVAAHLPGCMVVADNDASEAGLKAAKKIGRPYWMSTLVGEDFNDYSRRVGLFKSSQAIRALVK